MASPRHLLLLDSEIGTPITKNNLDFILNELKILKEENVKLNEELYRLKNTCIELKISTAETNNLSRKNNLIVFGLKLDDISDLKGYFIRICQVFLSISINSEDIIDTYKLGKGNNKLLLVHFKSQSQKAYVLLNSYKLKGSNVILDHDMPYDVRQKRKKLLQIRYEAVKENPGLKTFVTQDKLFINRHRFTWSDEKGLECKIPIGKKTPTKLIEQLGDLRLA